MNILKIVSDKLGVETGQEWEGSDGNLYIIEEEGILNLEPCQDSVTGYKWELCSGATYQKILTGELKPVWRPKVGDEYYIPLFTVDEAARYDSYRWVQDVFDKWYLENNLAFKTKEEAIAATNKMIKFIKEED